MKEIQRIRINQIKLPVTHTKAELDEAVKAKLHRKRLPAYDIVKQSIDARDKEHLLSIYNEEVPLDSEQGKQSMGIFKDRNILLTKRNPYAFKERVRAWDTSVKHLPLKVPPVIVGTGPAGLFCGYQLAKAGYQPILLERGKSVDQRLQQIEDYWQGAPLNESCNVQFGEGGAGTFSDGKLNSMIKDSYGRIREVLETFVSFGAHTDILYMNKPHNATDV